MSKCYFCPEEGTRPLFGHDVCESCHSRHRISDPVDDALDKLFDLLDTLLFDVVVNRVCPKSKGVPMADDYNIRKPVAEFRKAFKQMVEDVTR